MSREIKFRAYDRTQKVMIEFDLFDHDCDYLGCYSGAKEPVLADNCEIMQYTGLKDKNGKEIYEGDVVKEIFGTVVRDIVEGMNDENFIAPSDYVDIIIDKNFIYSGGHKGVRVTGNKLKKVEWNVKSCGFEPFSDSQENCGHCGGGSNPKNYEVLGNIYENPELLNKQNE